MQLYTFLLRVLFMLFISTSVSCYIALRCQNDKYSFNDETIKQFRMYAGSKILSLETLNVDLINGDVQFVQKKRTSAQLKSTT